LITRGRPARRENIEPVSSLKESDERFRVLVESIRDYAVFMLDRTGRVATWNTGAALIKGYRREEIVGKSIDLFYTREDRENGRPARLLAQAEKEGRIEDEGWRVRKDGTRFWADVVITALRNDAGALIGFAKVTRDLTQRQQADDERRRLEADRIRAEEALRIRDEFLSVASHELKTPLTSLQLELFGMRAPIEKSGDERLGRKLARAARSADRLSRLIEMLMDVSRIASGRLTLTPGPFDLREAMQQVVETMQATAARAGCDLSFHPSPEDGPIVGNWDRLRIEQVVMNLLTNAFKYGEGQPVTLSLAGDGNQATVEVRDHGPGIPEGDLERIFQRFERATAFNDHGGLGLGLYVSREIVNAHGGSLTARTLPEGGACFTVRLPLA
jgi:PAS domain S-box-containing protein